MGQPVDPNNRRYPQQPVGWQPSHSGPAGPVSGFPPSNPQHQQYQAAQQYQPPQPVPPARRRPWGFLGTGLVAGLLVAVLVGGILAVTGVLHFGRANDQPAAVSSAPITLPTTVPGFQDYLTAYQAQISGSSKSADARTTALQAQRAHSEKMASMTMDAYRNATPGAAVAFRQYADDKLDRVFSAIAVRATYPGLTNGPVVDPAFLQLAVAPQHIDSFGDVQCLVVEATTTPAGRTPNPDDEYTNICQRSGPTLTVQLYSGGAFSGTAGRQSMVDLTNSIWTGLSG